MRMMPTAGLLAGLPARRDAANARPSAGRFLQGQDRHRRGRRARGRKPVALRANPRPPLGPLHPRQSDGRPAADAGRRASQRHQPRLQRRRRRRADHPGGQPAGRDGATVQDAGGAFRRRGSSSGSARRAPTRRCSRSIRACPTRPSRICRTRRKSWFSAPPGRARTRTTFRSCSRSSPARSSSWSRAMPPTATSSSRSSAAKSTAGRRWRATDPGFRASKASCARWCGRAARRSRASNTCRWTRTWRPAIIGRALMSVRGAPLGIGRPFGLRPGTPADRVAMLKESLARLSPIRNSWPRPRTRRSTIGHIGAEEVTKAFNTMINQPPQVLEVMGKYLKAGGD